MTGTQRHWGAILALELAPAAILNFAVAFGVATYMRQAGLGAFAAAGSVAAGIATFLVAWVLLRRVGRSAERLPLPTFDTSPLEAELLRVHEADCLAEPISEELLLDDKLESVNADSRVVRLFEPVGTPTAGELQARIDRHLRVNASPAAPPDATQALHDAISALRQSLR